MNDRRVIKRGLLQRALVCLAVVGVCGLRPNVSTAGQADPKLALIEAIQQAPREKSAAAFLQQIEAADKLVPSADMAAVDSRMRTALHWSVLSAQSASSATLKDACRRLIEDLLAAGADVNAQDAYGNTPLVRQARNPAPLHERDRRRAPHRGAAARPVACKSPSPRPRPPQRRVTRSATSPNRSSLPGGVTP